MTATACSYMFCLQDGGVLKLIDLGAAALCRGDTEPLNYYPGNGPADPRYAKSDELYLLPPGSPRPTKDNVDKLWRAHRPDRFDSWSAGCTMLQLAVVGLRTDAALEQQAPERLQPRPRRVDVVHIAP